MTSAATAENRFHVSVVSLESVPSMEQGGQLESAAEISTAQEQDPDIGPLLSWLNSNDRPPWSTVAPCTETLKCYWAQWDSLHLREGVIYRLWESPAGNIVIWQILFPKKLQREVFSQLDSSLSAGHFGVTKTLSRVRECFYWAKCHQDIHNWCQSCDLCALKKGPSKRPKAFMRQYNVGSPTDRIALDILGPLSLSNEGKRYILVVSDYFTKWPEAYTLSNQGATTVAEVLVKEFVSCLGVPRELHLDQGCNLITTESNPTECVEPTDKVQSDEGALDIPSMESGATTTSNTTTPGVIAPAPSDGVSVLRRSSRLHWIPERYGDGHLGQVTLKEGSV